VLDSVAAVLDPVAVALDPTAVVLAAPEPAGFVPGFADQFGAGLASAGAVVRIDVLLAPAQPAFRSTDFSLCAFPGNANLLIGAFSVPGFAVGRYSPRPQRHPSVIIPPRIFADYETVARREKID